MAFGRFSGRFVRQSDRYIYVSKRVANKFTYYTTQITVSVVQIVLIRYYYLEINSLCGVGYLEWCLVRGE